MRDSVSQPGSLDASARSIDLDAYCARIAYTGPREPTLATLRALQELHPAAIPFEAIDVLLGRGVDLAPAAVDAKLIGAGRGGYCFEQNGLFRRALNAIGFKVEGLTARVRWMQPAGAPPMPRTHMVLRVMIDGEPWLADVGFGGCVPTVPLRLNTDALQPSRHESFRIARGAGTVIVEAQRHDAWLPLYEVYPDPQLAIDYEVANWFTATHAESPFRRNLIAARTTPAARYALLDNRLTARKPGGDIEQRMLDADALETALAEIFGLPVAPDWRPAIEAAVGRAAAG
ncbi:MAG TPA: arylamine N-acetyltransferase [Pseudolabrys sp.]|nr:arylamine N-acetyltransferase [Pseudolabrys sp.]